MDGPPKAKPTWFIAILFWLGLICVIGVGVRCLLLLPPGLSRPQVLAGVLTGFNRNSGNLGSYLQTSGYYTLPEPFGLYSTPVALQAAAVAQSIGPGLVVS